MVRLKKEAIHFQIMYDFCASNIYLFLIKVITILGRRFYCTMVAKALKIEGILRGKSIVCLQLFLNKFL